MISNLKKFDDELQIVYGEVYCPNVPDSQGDFMIEVEVRKMAHNFMRTMAMDKVDTNHDNVLNESMVVECFIARKDDPDFLANAWVVGVHVPDIELWKQVKSGELNGFSMEAFVKTKENVLELEIPEVVEGDTQSVNGHEHTFQLYFDDEGNIIGGITSFDDNHQHSISRGTTTDEEDGHKHRYSFTESLVNEQT